MKFGRWTEVAGNNSRNIGPLEMARAIGWCFTLNNPTFEHGEPPFASIDEIAFATWQLESGERNTPHYQGYVHFKSRKRLTQVRVVVPGAHLEKRRGTVAQAIAYANKEDTRVDGPWSIGEVPRGQGARNDIHDAYAAIKGGASIESVADEMPGVHAKYHRGLEKYQLMKMARRDFAPEVHVLIGVPGSGKTRFVFDNHEAGDIYTKDPTNKWWDGYIGQEVVLIDDFYGSLRFNYLLRLLDRYPMRLEVKGGHTQMLAKKIYITSNAELEDWYSNPSLNLDALKRRITRVHRFRIEVAA